MIIASCLFFFFLSCGKDASTNPGEIDFPEKDLSFSQHIRPVLLNRCAFSGCHSSRSKAGGLDLQKNPPVFQSAAGQVVIPFDAAQSLLFLLLSNSVNGISRMPIGGSPLSDAIKKAVETWIDEGADVTN